MQPKLYGYQHILFLTVFFAVLILSVILVRKNAKSDRAVRAVLRCVGVVHLAATIWSRVSMTLWLNDWMSLLPDSFCSLSSLLMPLCLLLFLKKDSGYLHFIWYFSIFGGLITIFYPDFIGQDASFFFQPTISGLCHHAMLVYSSVMLVATNYFTPTLKKGQCLPLGGACVMTYGIFLLTALGEEDALHIETPLIEGSVFYWYVVAAIALAVSYTIMAVCDAVRAARSRRLAAGALL